MNENQQCRGQAARLSPQTASVDPHAEHDLCRYKTAARSAKRWAGRRADACPRRRRVALGDNNCPAS